MNRRSFLLHGSVLTTGLTFRDVLAMVRVPTDHNNEITLYSIFRNPGNNYKPFVRWWWNGDKIEKAELARELRLLKDAGIGGVEINPIKFPGRTDDLGIPSIPWLSDEWIELLQFAFREAKLLGLTCDLIVGSGWPFGAEWLAGEECSQIVVIGTKKLEGPLDYEVSLSDLFKEADPPISSPFPGRKMEMLSVTLTPATINSFEEIKDLSDQIPNGTIHCKIAEGKYVLYALVKISSFMQVIQGALGATGPVLNHYNEEAVKKYLHKMSDAIQKKLGPLSSQIRSLFSDSLELEGANWSRDMRAEFQKRRGYDLMPWLPYILYKIGGMGNTWVYDYGAEMSPAFKEMIQRIRYDFEWTKAELIRERFVNTFINWCKENKVQSRMQAYGRGYFPLEGSFGADIPEGETWIRPGLGVEMNETNYAVGRAYTMINKFVSSAAHLKNKKHISCEELTNIHMVFNETLELMKISGDQSIISGMTHPIFHGFNYSPPNTKFPGWVIYGTFINERNPWWPYFPLFTAYKARLSALLQQATMYADIAIMPAITDTWSIYSAQNEPFPAVMYPSWQTLIWECIHQNGNGCDYISEQVIRDAKIQNGYLQYGSRKYHTIFFTQVESIEPATAGKLFEFVSNGGKIFFIEAWPKKANGWNDHERRDNEVQTWISKLKNFPERCIFLNKPDKNFTDWFGDIKTKYGIKGYVDIYHPNPFISQVRYQTEDTEILIFQNSSSNDAYRLNLHPVPEITAGKEAWIWDPETGERYRILPDIHSIPIDLGPAELKLIVFDKEKKGDYYQPLKAGDITETHLTKGWMITGHHINGTIIKKETDEFQDLKDIPEWTSFCGTIIYQNIFEVQDVRTVHWMKLAKTFGVSELLINGQSAGVKWYGQRIYHINKLIRKGNNTVEIRIVTTPGNYLKSLTDNPIGQYWTNEGRTIQPVQSIGLTGHVSFY